MSKEPKRGAKPAIPTERTLNKSEREALAEAYRRGRATVKKHGVDPRNANRPMVLKAIDTILAERRDGRVSRSARLGAAVNLGALFGAEIVEHLGWEWRFVTFAGGVATYAVVAPDRSLLVLPMLDANERVDSERRGSFALLFALLSTGRDKPGEPGEYVRVRP